jgi:transcriptional regulator with XRE-family HTH domain
LNPLDRYKRFQITFPSTFSGFVLALLTFQQVQKYKKGTNRIGASRLQQISHIL